VARVQWAVQTGSEHELFVICVRWAVRTYIEQTISVASVRTLILYVRTLYRETDYSDSLKSLEDLLQLFISYLEKYIANLPLSSHFHY
jgi:hypothetical protein